MRTLRATGWLAITGIPAWTVCLVTPHFFTDVQSLCVASFFREHMREPLFTGLLTVAAFLFSLQTFIVVTMKQNVYDNKKYEELHASLKSLNPGLKRYGPLSNFSTLLFWSIFLSLVSAVVQFTIGLVDGKFAVAISLATAIWSIAMIFVSLFYLQANLKKWFEFIDDPSG